METGSEIRNHNHNTIRPAIRLLSLCVLILAVSAVFLPWFRWSQHTWMTANGKWLNTTNLNYLLPTMAVGTDEAIGAQAEDGNRVLSIGYVARWIILAVSALSFWQLLRNRVGLAQFLLPGLLLVIFLGLFSYVVLNNLIIDVVILENKKMLPYITGLEWSGPTSLVSAMFLQILALLVQSRTKALSNSTPH